MRNHQRLVLFAPPRVDDGPPVARFLEPGSLRSFQGGPSGLLLDVSVAFTVAQTDLPAPPRPWEPRMHAYRYRLLDHGHTELLVYHWQPGEAYAGPDEPHLHVSAFLNARIDAVATRAIGLDKLHVATGLVSLAAVVRMLITEFGIAPHRSDWGEALDRIETTF